MAQSDDKEKWRQFVLAVVLALIATIPPTLMSLAALLKASDTEVKVDATHDLVNSRMTEMLEVVKAAATAKGILTEKTREQAARGEAAEQLPNRIDHGTRK